MKTLFSATMCRTKPNINAHEGFAGGVEELPIPHTMNLFFNAALRSIEAFRVPVVISRC